MSTPGPLVTELTARTLIAPGIADLSFKMISPAELCVQRRAVRFDRRRGARRRRAPSRRSYSIASQSDAGGTLRFIIRVIPSGAASELLMSASIGSPMRMTGPHGFFVLDADHAGDVVFGATGTGVAAVMPMLGELSRTVDRGRRYLYWGLRHETDIFAHDEIARLCERAGHGAAHLPDHPATPPGTARAGGSPRRSWTSCRASRRRRSTWSATAP